MRAVRATVEDGKVTLSEPIEGEGKFDAIVVLLDADPWDAIVADPRSRKGLQRAREEALADFAAGKTTPIDPDNMQ